MSILESCACARDVGSCLYLYNKIIKTILGPIQFGEVLHSSNLPTVLEVSKDDLQLSDGILLEPTLCLQVKMPRPLFLERQFVTVSFFFLKESLLSSWPSSPDWWRTGAGPSSVRNAGNHSPQDVFLIVWARKLAQILRYTKRHSVVDGNGRPLANKVLKLSVPSCLPSSSTGVWAC